MLFPQKIRDVLKNDWVIGLGLFLVFLAANGYTYAWDDQHIEIPLLKSLIDPGLYAGDYYVESLKKNFTTFLFPILAKLITVEQVPTAYFILYLISRFFLFFYAYKLWKIISRDRLNAALCVLSFILISRVEEFLYRTFSHQEFALAIIMAAMYYFYKSRYARAAILFGIAANFHALYSLFPFSYMCFYLLRNSYEDKGRGLLRSLGLFTLFALPVLVWISHRFLNHGPVDQTLYQGWLNLYQIACSQNFLFQDQPLSEMLNNLPIFFRGSAQFWPVIALLALNYAYNPGFRKDQKTQSSIIAASLLILISFIFTYVFPSRFILDLNLVRNLQFLQFILIGYTTLLMVTHVRSSRWILAVSLISLYMLFRFGNYLTTLAAIEILLLLSLKARFTKNPRLLDWQKIIYFVLAFGILIGILAQFHFNHFSYAAIMIFEITVAVAIGIFITAKCLPNEKIQDKLRILIITIPFIALTINYGYFHYLHLKIERTGGGFWQLQRNWIDMQNYVRTHTPKNAMLLVPNDMEMGGFRILSERKVLCCYRDCGIIGFDYAAAKEWQNRLKDIEHFKVRIDGDIAPALVNAVLKYKVNYIVFMRYVKPGGNAMLEPMYENEAFSLYRVVTNPI